MSAGSPGRAAAFTLPDMGRQPQEKQRTASQQSLRRRLDSTWIVAVAAVAAAGAAGVLIWLTLREPAPPAASPSCAASPGTTQRDVDPQDTPEAPWPGPPGEPVVVTFTIGQLPPRYARLVQEAAQIWSRGSCVDAVTAASCPDRGNCSTVRVRDRAQDDDTDGESESVDRGGVRISNTITLYTDLLEAASDNGALATVVHEMGHALGLVHRNDPTSVMNAETDDDTDPVPDEIDFANLVAVYGT